MFNTSVGNPKSVEGEHGRDDVYDFENTFYYVFLKPLTSHGVLAIGYQPIFP